MDRPPVVMFKRKFSDSSPSIVNKLRQLIQENVVHTSFRHFHKFSICLPALYLFPEPFKQQYIISMCDLDMKNDLKTSKVINWCPYVKSLYPVTTTGDGNCLLHAVSLALWGIEDSDQLLRRLLYLTLSLSDGNTSVSTGSFTRIHQRWKYVQDEFKKQHPHDFNYDITSMDEAREWTNVVKAASDIVEGGRPTAGTAFPTLEGVHIFALSNLLQRPIIVLAERTARSVYGNSMQENSLYGIYLPLDVKHSDICKTPIVLGYNLNHFAPLVTQANSPDGEGSSQSILPLLMEDFTNLPVRFLLREEEHIAGDLMKKYLFVKNIPLVRSDGINSIPGVVLQHQMIHDDLDIVSAHRRECEQIYLNSGVPYSQTAPGANVIASTSTRVPATRSTVQRDVLQRTNVAHSNIAGNDPTPCTTPGCAMFGTPTTANMCSSCFNKYTIEYGRREAERKGQRLPSEPTAPPLTFNRQESFTDLSVMGEKCCNPNCGNRCSVNTYPFCHECKPQISNGSGSAIPTPESGTAQRSPPDISVMDKRCRNPKCDNYCSVHTDPFCHECRPIFMETNPTPMPGLPASAMTSGHNHPQTTGLTPTLPPGHIEAQPWEQFGSHPHAQFGTGAQGYSASIQQIHNRISPSAATPQIPNRTLLPVSSSGASAMHEGYSMMNEQCQGTTRCTNYCSRNTHPYCHECYPKYLPGNSGQVLDLALQGVSGPPSHPSVAGSVSSPRVLATSTEQITQEAGNEHIDDNSLFGEGTVPIVPLSNQHGELVISPTSLTTSHVQSRQPNNHLSTEEFEEVAEPNSFPSNFVFNSGPSSQTHVVHNVKQNNNDISTSEGTPSPAESNPNISFPGPSGSQRISESSYVVIGLGTISERSNSDPSQPQAQGQSPESQERLKQLCSTPGCSGARVFNNFGYCLDCWNRTAKGGEDPGELPRPMESEPVESRQPQLNTAEINSMHPIVTSSKDKKDCASPLCNKKVYPPNKLCGHCIEVLRQGQTRSLEEQTSPRERRKSLSYSPSRPKCKKANCDFHGSTKTNGYCSQCHKEETRTAIANNFPQTPTLSNIPVPRRHSNPPYPPYVTPYNVPAGGTTLPPIMASNRPIIQGATRMCLEPGCDKFGDPQMYYRCTEHYRATMSHPSYQGVVRDQSLGVTHTQGMRRTPSQGVTSEFQVQPPPSNRYMSQGEVMRYNTAEQQPRLNTMEQTSGYAHPSQVAAPSPGGFYNNLSRLPNARYQTGPAPPMPQSGAFQSAMTHVENNMKNLVLCKTEGCRNFGSGTRRGYCNNCSHSTLQRRGTDSPPHDLPADDPRMNYGCC